jgi:hypothetical protein
LAPSQVRILAKPAIVIGRPFHVTNRRRAFAFQPVQGARLSSCKRVRKFRAPLRALEVQLGAAEVDMVPTQIDELANAESMPVCEQNHRRVTMPGANAGRGGFDQGLDLVGREVESRSELGFGLAAWRERLPISRCP